MSEFTTKITEVQDSVLETVADVQSSVVDVVQTIVEAVSTRVPELKFELPESVPTITELIEVPYAFAGKVLANSQHFTTELIESVKPVTSRLVAEPVVKAPAKSTAKAKAA